MGIIEINNFSFSFGDKIIFDNTSFMLNNNEKIGIVGVNGAGKSTFIKVLTGDILLDSGNIYKNNKYNIKYLDQYVTINGTETIKEYLSGAYKHLFEVEEKYNKINIELSTTENDAKLEKLLNQSGDLYEYLLENDFYTIDSNIEKVASGLGVTALGMNTHVDKLSGGQRAKVLLSKLILENPDVMILDEPTNFLDVNHIDWLSKYIKNSEKAYIIVSHDEKFLNSVVTHIYDLDNGKMNKYLGDLKKVKEIKMAKSEQLKKAYNSQQKQIKKLEDYIAKNKARASTAKMAHSREKWLDKMEIITPPTEKVKPTFSFAYKDFEGNLILKTNNLVVGYTHPLLKNPINLELIKGERLAIVGFNGIGKTTLLKTIMGKLNEISGSTTISKSVEIGYYEQDNNFKDFDGTPLMYILQKFPKLTEKQVRASLSKCGLKSEHLRNQINKLSGGEQSKIKICELTIKPSNLLILDEPTNHLDELAIARLKEAISEYKGTVIFVSHDKHFISEVSTNILDLEKSI